MKITENTIEYQIKKQIGEREVTPARDLWAEIESQTENKKVKSGVNWFLVAACLVLTFSLVAVLFFNHENPKVEKSANLAKAVNPEVQISVPNETQKKPSELIIKNNQQKIAVEKVSPNIKEDFKQSPAIIQEELPAIRQTSSDISEASTNEPSKAMAQSDSTKIQVKKKRYVDPSTLLFSVEHKDVIEKTKGKSNVASIDLNGN